MSILKDHRFVIEETIECYEKKNSQNKKLFKVKNQNLKVQWWKD